MTPITSSSNLTPAKQAQLDQLLASPAINANGVSGFSAVPNSTTGGIDVSFNLVSLTGIDSITLLRNFVPDIGTATVLQTWNPLQAAYAWSDTDNALANIANAYYWLTLAPTGVSGKSVNVGPIILLLNPQLTPPPPATDISASSSATVNGKVTITVNVTAVEASSIKIYVSGYHGSATFVAVAQQSTAPIQFVLDATGEEIVLEAISVSTGGTEAATGPTTTAILNGAPTLPAKVMGVVVAQISTGNQITFPQSLDKVTSYKIFKAPRQTPFFSATLLTTLTSTASVIDYLDTAGLQGDSEYFVVATNPVGDSLESDAATPFVMFTSALMPTNVPVNTTNTATVDSIDAGSTALIRVYGPSGVGTSYNRITGFGSETRPPGDITGLGYSTTYSVMWTGTDLIAVTSYVGTLPDNYELVATVTTPSATGVVGTGATLTIVIDGSGHVIQANPGALGNNYLSATVDLGGGGGGSGAQIQANVDVPSGTIPTYTVLTGGDGYTVAPTGTVVGGGAAGVPGGGGATGGTGGSRVGCVEEGTVVEVPEGTVETLESCNEWTVIDIGSGPLYMHPDTLVSVFKKASDLTSEDMIEVKAGKWARGSISSDSHPGVKVKRTCPGGVYHAGPSMIRLHNFKPVLSE
jgi:hypothetical protein